MEKELESGADDCFQIYLMDADEHYAYCPSWSYVADLIDFGAVYYALVCPTPPPSATQEQVEIFKRVTAPSVLQKRSSIKGKTVREAQKTYRITRSDEFVETGTYLRVHVHPKRFPR